MKQLSTLFKQTIDDYDIHKISSRYYAKFNTDHYEWNISGIVIKS